MKPEWCPQDVWDEAHDVAVQVLTEYGEQIKTMRPLIARALLEAHQRGRREGMEEAATIAETHRHPRGIENEDARWCAGTASAATFIRIKAQDVKL